ncbi:hypothetical protein ACVXZY_13295 [Staphylococcus aureus]
MKSIIKMLGTDQFKLIFVSVWEDQRMV